MSEDATVELIRRVEGGLQMAAIEHANAPGMHGASTESVESLRTEFYAFRDSFQPLYEELAGLVAAARESAARAAEAAAEAERIANEPPPEPPEDDAPSEDETPPPDDGGADDKPDRRALLDRPIFGKSN